MDDEGESLEVSAWPPDRDGLRHLVAHVKESYGSEEVMAVIESMNGARFVHDTLELSGWSVEIADAHKVKGLAPLACKTDKSDLPHAEEERALRAAPRAQSEEGGSVSSQIRSSRQAPRINSAPSRTLY